MNQSGLIRFIQQVLPMSPAKARLIAEKFKPMKIKKNGYILKAGTICSQSHFIDSGVMIHSTGPYGAVNAGGDALSNPIGSGAFMVSVEYQVASGDVGGLYNLGPISKTDSARAGVASIANDWNQVKIVVQGELGLGRAQ